MRWLSVWGVLLMLMGCGDKGGSIPGSTGDQAQSTLSAETINEGNGQATAQAVQSDAPDTPEGMVLIPAGEFLMGSNDVDASGKSQEFGFNEPMYLNEQPQRKVNLPAYYIDKYEVTNKQFKKFLQDLNMYSDAQIEMLVQRLQMQRDDAPMRNITWTKADEYCRHYGKRLPSEAEWEKAARGPNGNEFPWGDEWNADYVNAGQGETDVSAVGSFEKGKSFYGVYDMAGNVMEWTADWYKAYPGAQYQSPNYGEKHRVVRGGSWGGVGHYVIPHYFRVAYRYNFEPNAAYNDVGFRCVKDLN